MATWSGTVYVEFVIDRYSRRILGWRAATTMSTPLVLDALEQAIWTRGRAGITNLVGLVHHTDAGSPICVYRVHRTRHGDLNRRASGFAVPGAATTQQRLLSL